MKQDLWHKNTPEQFWKFLIDIPHAHWIEAVQKSRSILGTDFEIYSDDELSRMILGEGQFGDKHWELSTTKKIYYHLKPFIPRRISRILRQMYGTPVQVLGWPVEDRYVRFLWEIAKCLLQYSNKRSLPFVNFWKNGKDFSFILTHDVETKEGQNNIRRVADMEEQLGFRSSFNFIPERYKLDYGLMEELKKRGFEIGVHGLKHDGKLFSSRDIFIRRAERINKYLQEFHAVGFRTPLMQRNPEWMQILEMDYDLSFFDTDPFEAISGGTMTIYPFQIGRFLELPYTLVQDYSLVEILNEKTPDIWLKKIDFIEQYYGMALVNVHPDYLIKKENWHIYQHFLTLMKNRDNYWHCLAKDAAIWWNRRMSIDATCKLDKKEIGNITLRDGQIVVENVD